MKITFKLSIAKELYAQKIITKGIDYSSERKLKERAEDFDKMESFILDITNFSLSEVRAFRIKASELLQNKMLIKLTDILRQ